MTSKQDTRKQALNQRDSIPYSVRVRKSQVICDRLLCDIGKWAARRKGTGEAVQADGICEAAAVSGASAASDKIRAEQAPLAIAAYEPMRSEVDVHPLLQEAYRRGWGVFLPCMAKDTVDGPARMVFFPIAREQLTDNRPIFLDHPARPLLLDDLHADGWQETDPKVFDVAIIPMVAYDAGLMRLGYGGGNYDRFLPQLRPDCYVAGVAFEEQKVAHVPTEPHDLSLPRIYSA